MLNATRCKEGYGAYFYDVAVHLLAVIGLYVLLYVAVHGETPAWNDAQKKAVERGRTN